MFKRVLRSDTVDTKSKFHCVLKTYADVAQHLKERFCTEGWEKQHGIDSSFTVNKVCVHEAGLGEITRPKIDVEFDSIDGIQKSFAYKALRPGVVLQRWFDCWCPVCMALPSPGDGRMDSNYRVAGCCCQQHWMAATSSDERKYWEHALPHLRGKCNDPGSPFRWWECSVQRKDTVGVRGRQVEAQAKGREMARQIQIDEILAFQDRENQNHTYPYLLAIAADAGNGSCVLKQVTGREKIDGTSYTAGDFVLSVRW